MKKILLILLFLLLPVLASAQTYTYYVCPSPTGDNSNDGLSQSAPWESLRYAASQLNSGDTLYLMDGTYDDLGQAITDDLPVRFYDSNITIKAVNKQAAILDGGGVLMPLESGYSQAAAIILDSILYVTIDGLWIRNIGIHDVTNPGRPHFGIWAIHANYLTLQNSKIGTIRSKGEHGEHFMPGINIEGGDNSLIKNNEFYDIWNQVGGLNASGIAVWEGRGTPGAYNNIIEHNLIYNCGGGIYDKSEAIYDSNTIIRFNLVYDCNDGIGTSASSVTIRQNIVYNGAGTTARGIRLANLYGSISNITVENNTIYNCRAGIADGSWNYHTLTVNMWSNIVYGFRDAGWMDNRRCYVEDWDNNNPEPTNWVSDFNCWYDANTTDVVHWSGNVWTLAELQANKTYNSTAMDESSINVNPQFVNPPTDFHLQSGSPCKGTGKDGVDMGAYITGNEEIGIETEEEPRRTSTIVVENRR